MASNSQEPHSSQELLSTWCDRTSHSNNPHHHINRNARLGTYRSVISTVGITSCHCQVAPEDRRVESDVTFGEDDRIDGIPAAIQRVVDSDAIPSSGEINLKVVRCADPAKRCVCQTISIDV